MFCVFVFKDADTSFCFLIWIFLQKIQFLHVKKKKRVSGVLETDPKQCGFVGIFSLILYFIHFLKYHHINIHECFFFFFNLDTFFCLFLLKKKQKTKCVIQKSNSKFYISNLFNNNSKIKSAQCIYFIAFHVFNYKNIEYKQYILDKW